MNSVTKLIIIISLLVILVQSVLFIVPNSKQVSSILNRCVLTHKRIVVLVGGPKTCCNFLGDTIESTRNIEYTDRATNDPAHTQTVELGVYRDVAPTQHTMVDPSNGLDAILANNLEEFELDNVLEREYQVDSYAWTTTQAVDGQIASTVFPDVLFAQTYIADKLANFRYFRAAVNISFRVVSNPFVYGKLLAYYVPYGAPTPIANYPAVYASGYPHVLLDAGSGDTVQMSIPYIYPNRFLDLLSSTAGFMGTVYTLVLNPLTDIQGTSSPSAYVYVTASFTDTVAIMPHDNTSVALAEARGFVMESGRKGYSNKEANKKSVKNTISKTEEVADTISSGIETVAKIGGYIATAINIARPMFGLSKPRSLATTNINVLDPWHDSNTGAGISTGRTIGYDPENRISTRPNVAGISHDEMDFVQLAGTPSLVNSFGFGPSTSAQILCNCSFVGYNQFGFNSGYAEWLANNFLYVSGSKKVKIYITASGYHSARFVLYLSDTGATDNWMNCYHQFVDVQGPTEVSFTLPYTNSQVAQLVTTAGVPNDFVLWALPLSWSQPDNAVDAPIYFNVYTAAAADFRLRVLQDVAFQVESSPRNDFAQDFPFFYEKFSGYECTGLVCGEEYTHLRQVLHRYHALMPTADLSIGNLVSVYNSAGNLAVRNATSTPPITPIYGGVVKFGLVYSFYRGSMRYRFLPYTNTDSSGAIITTVAIYSSQNSTLGPMTSGFSATNLIKPVLDIDVPYNDNLLFRPTKSTTPVGGTIFLGTNGKYYMFEAAGDDFSFHFISPPPMPASITNGGFVTPSNGDNGLFGLQGLGNFYNTPMAA
jgi:hypothetical protein